MIDFECAIEKETEKAVYVCTQQGYAGNTTRYTWLPKSACKIEEFVQTVNPATNKPQTYGKRVVAIAEWLWRKIAD